MKGRRGLTLIETLLTSLILLLTVAALYVFLALGVNSYWASRVYLDLQQSARLVISYVTTDLMEAVPNLPNSPAVSLPNLTNPTTSELIFNRAVYPFDPFHPRYEVVRYVYNPAKKTVDLYVNSVKQRSIGKNIKTFQVRRRTDILYEITVAAEDNAGGKTLTFTLVSSVHLPYGTL